MNLTRTPAQGAQLCAAIDRPARQLGTWPALGIILGVYAVFFASSDVGAVLEPPGGQIENYASKLGIIVLTGVAAEIAAALAIFYLVCQWLAIPRPLAGIPRPRLTTIALGDRRRVISSMWPAAWLVSVAAAGGMVLSVGVDILLSPAGEATDATNMTSAANLPSILGGALRSTNAGIVEEIIIVALPVLLGRRAGWHPAVIVALSVAMRYPYHLYHGTWSTVLLWTIAWAAPHALAYLYLRRLWPLIITHICQDLLAFYAPHDALYYATGIAFFVIIGAAALRGHIGHQQRRRTITDSTGTAITYYRLDNGVITIKNKAKTLPNIWATLTAISQDQPRRPGIIRCTTGRGSVQAEQLADHGYPRPRYTAYRIPIPLHPALAKSDLSK